MAFGTPVQAWALVKLYQLEQRQDERNTRVELFIELGGEHAEEGGNVPEQNVRTTNLSPTAVHIDRIKIEVEALGDHPGRAESYMGFSEVVMPYQSKWINVICVGRRGAKPLSVPKTWREGKAVVVVDYQAYGRHGVAHSVPFVGQINPWGGFDPPWKPLAQ